MEISNLKILAIRLILSDKSKSELSSVLGVDPAVLSREIRNKDLLKKIDSFFNEIDPQINILASRLRSDTSMVEEAAAGYGEKKAMSEVIKEKDRTIHKMEETIKIQGKTIDLLEDQYQRVLKQSDRLEMQLSELNDPGKSKQVS